MARTELNTDYNSTPRSTDHAWRILYIDGVPSTCAARMQDAIMRRLGLSGIYRSASTTSYITIFINLITQKS